MNLEIKDLCTGAMELGKTENVESGRENWEAEEDITQQDAVRYVDSDDENNLMASDRSNPYIDEEVEDYDDDDEEDDEHENDIHDYNFKSTDIYIYIYIYRKKSDIKGRGRGKQ